MMRKSVIILFFAAVGVFAWGLIVKFREQIQCKGGKETWYRDDPLGDWYNLASGETLSQNAMIEYCNALDMPEKPTDCPEGWVIDPITGYCSLPTDDEPTDKPKPPIPSDPTPPDDDTNPDYPCKDGNQVTECNEANSPLDKPGKPWKPTGMIGSVYGPNSRCDEGDESVRFQVQFMGYVHPEAPAYFVVNPTIGGGHFQQYLTAGDATKAKDGGMLFMGGPYRPCDFESGASGGSRMVEFYGADGTFVPSGNWPTCVEKCKPNEPDEPDEDEPEDKCCPEVKLEIPKVIDVRIINKCETCGCAVASGDDCPT